MSHRPFPLQVADAAEGASQLDHNLVMDMTRFMEMLSVSNAKAGFSGIAREVIRTKKTVIVRVPHGFIQIAPYELPAEVSPAPKGTIKRTAREIELGNILGDAL